MTEVDFDKQMQIELAKLEKKFRFIKLKFNIYNYSFMSRSLTFNYNYANFDKPFSIKITSHATIEEMIKILIKAIYKNINDYFDEILES
jgi:hypothetical protein